MPTDSLAKAVLSAAFVGVLLALLRRAGPRAGGLAAAVPVSSVPALFWLSAERGSGFAAAAAAGSLWATGVTALLVLAAIALAQRTLAAIAASSRPRRWRADAPISMAQPAACRSSSASCRGMAGRCSAASSPRRRWSRWRQRSRRTGKGVRDELPFLRGYLDGMLAKAVFLSALGLSWSAGAGMAGWPLALASAGTALRIQRTAATEDVE